MEQTSDSNEQKILVVEDAEDLVNVWRVLFRKAGIGACFCSSGQAALSTIEHGDFLPTVVMTDYYLPDITGLDLIHEIRKRNQSIDYLMVSGNKDDAFVETIAKNNISLVPKPVRFPDLLKALQTVSQRRSA